MIPSNEQRSERFAQLLPLYPDDEHTNFVDLLADALHWCSREEINFSQALGLAVMHFAAETMSESSTEDNVES